MNFNCFPVIGFLTSLKLLKCFYFCLCFCWNAKCFFWSCFMASSVFFRWWFSPLRMFQWWWKGSAREVSFIINTLIVGKCGAARWYDGTLALRMSRKILTLRRMKRKVKWRTPFWMLRKRGKRLCCSIGGFMRWDLASYTISHIYSQFSFFLISHSFKCHTRHIWTVFFVF